MTSSGAVTQIFSCTQVLYGLLICTQISENQGLEKSRSISNLRKISGLQTLISFPGSTLTKARFIIQIWQKLGAKPKKIFLGFETDLDFSNQRSGCRLKGQKTYVVQKPVSRENLTSQMSYRSKVTWHEDVNSKLSF